MWIHAKLRHSRRPLNGYLGLLMLLLLGDVGLLLRRCLAGACLCFVDFDVCWSSCCVVILFTWHQQRIVLFIKNDLQWWRVYELSFYVMTS